jgi:CRP/FNR family cyclic AMP-dependent transcriptional regulator
MVQSLYLLIIMTNSNNLHLYQLILAHVLKRIDLTADEQQHFCSILSIKQVLPRQYIVQQGDVCRYESYVCKGFLRSFYMDEKGEDHTLHFAMEDWWITDATSFLKQEPATRNIVALEPSTLLQIDKQAMEQLYTDIPAFEKFWRILNQNSTMAQDQRILNAISMTGAQRYEALIQKYPTLEQRMPQKHIASYLGITPVFLSQIRKNASRY